MQGKVSFSFFILCVLLFHGIIAKFLEKNVEESSRHLVRQKRVINRRPGAEILVKPGDLPYIVNLRQQNRQHCMATILSIRTAITAARCFYLQTLSLYTVASGSSFSHHGTEHNVTRIQKHGQNPSRTPEFETGIALVTVNPPFVYSHTTRNIALHSGPVLADMEAIIAGWGRRVAQGPVEVKNNIKKLRIIGVPIMDHRQCQNIYRGHFPITDEDVCTYHPEKLCGDTDTGAPLIIDNELAGVHIGRIYTQEGICPIKPDVFVLVQHYNYASWITSHIVH